MSEPANITVIRGPDEGKSFSFEGDMVNLGRGAQNEVALSDESLDDYQASIVRKNGRFAIYTPLDDGVQVDGNGIPSDQWVWLPETALLSLRESTVLKFTGEANGENASAGDVAKSADPPSTPPAAKRRKKRKAPGKGGPKDPASRRGRKVAKFITDREGDRLVRLGEDGSLPELALAESAAPKKTTRQSGERGSPLLYVAVGVSMLMSLAMLFVDPESGGSTKSQRDAARNKIRKQFFGSGTDLKPYQKYLREAQRAYSSGNRQAERRAYERVLDELNAEDVVRSLNGLTGDKDQDNELRELIGILLNRRD